MSDKSKRLFLVIVGLVFVFAIVALTAVIAFSVGRSSVPGSDIAGNYFETATGISPTEKIPSPSPDSSDLQPAEEIVIEADGDNDNPETITIDPNHDAPETMDQSTDQIQLEAEDLELLIEVWDIVNEEFDGSLPEEQDVTYRAIAGSLELLDDDFTRFVPADIARITRERLEGSFEGIGAFVDLSEEGYLLIVRPIEGQPADRAGLESDDLITHVDGEPVQGKSLEEIITLVKGPQGTVVMLTVVRESSDDPFDVTIVRELIEIPIVESELLESEIGYVRLSGFSGSATDQLEQSLEDLLSQNPQGLILDLRDNPGGFLHISVEVTDLFLPEGIILYQRDNAGNEEIFRSDDGDLAEDIELVLLVNEGSASASEIVAGAIKDYDRGIIVGQTTFGKGSVQQTNTLSDGSELRVTIARWYTPDNMSIDEAGIVPDVEVETPDQFGGEDDLQLQRAIELILEEN